jgi:hypothetical protein
MITDDTTPSVSTCYGPRSVTGCRQWDISCPLARAASMGRVTQEWSRWVQMNVPILHLRGSHRSTLTQQNYLFRKETLNERLHLHYYLQRTVLSSAH